jgi:hypothetical protein
VADGYSNCMPLRQQTLFGEVLSYNPTPSSSSSLSRVDPPVCLFRVIFDAESGGITSEKLFLQNCRRDGWSLRERAHIAAEHQSPYDVARVREVTNEEETDISIDESDEWRVAEWLNS